MILGRMYNMLKCNNKLQFENTYRHVNLLTRQKSLLLKAKTLYFIEVNCSLHMKFITKNIQENVTLNDNYQ